MAVGIGGVGAIWCRLMISETEAMSWEGLWELATALIFSRFHWWIWVDDGLERVWFQLKRAWRYYS